MSGYNVKCVSRYLIVLVSSQVFYSIGVHYIYSWVSVGAWDLKFVLLGPGVCSLLAVLLYLVCVFQVVTV